LLFWGGWGPPFLVPPLLFFLCRVLLVPELLGRLDLSKEFFLVGGDFIDAFIF